MKAASRDGRRRSAVARGLLFAVFLGSGLAAASASDRNVRFERVSLAEGHSQAQVFSMLQDREGFLWFGTAEGLYRYDGITFSLFIHKAGDEKSLSHDSIRALTQDPSGVLWVGTAGGGLNRFDPIDESFTRVPGNDIFDADRIRALLTDSDGALWVGTDESGLARLDPATGEIAFFSIPEYSEKTSEVVHVRDIVEDREGVIWVATDGHGLLHVSAAGELERWEGPLGASSALLSADRIGRLLEDSEGNLWVGTYEEGLARIDADRRWVEHFQHEPGKPESLSANGIWEIYEDASGVLWVGTDAGLNEWKRDSGAFSRHRHDSANPYSLDNDRVVSILQDRSGVMWVGTLSGLNRWNPITASFRHLRRQPGRGGGLGANYVTSFAEDSEGALWVGTHRGGLNRLDPETGEFRRYLHDVEDPWSLADDTPTALVAGPPGTLWVGTFGAGLDRLDLETGRFEHFRHRPDDDSSLSWDGVTALARGGERSLWIGTYGGGLNRLDLESGEFIRYRHDPEHVESLTSDRITAVFVDRAGVVWVGTDGSGLNRLEPETGALESYRHDPSDSAGISGNTVWAIAEDADGDLWIGTEGNGLNRWSAEDRSAGRVRFRHFGKRDGLRSSTIYAIQIDDERDVWLSTNAGLARLDADTGTFIHYDASHGLQSNEFNLGAAFTTSDGMMLFGGVNGFNAFYPSEIRGNEHVPPVVLTAFSKFNKSVEFDRPLRDVEHIDLTYKDSVISFEFAALDFTAPHKNQYRYKLVGFDEDWVEAGTRRRATYTNLAAGNYVFRVQGSNNDGVWNREGVSVSLTVGPHPMQSRVAYGIYSLMALGAFGLYTRVQHRRREHAEYLRRTNEALITEVAQRKEKEKALEQERRRAQRYLDVAEVIMLVVDEEGIVRLINPKGCRVLGRQLHEVIGQRWVREFVQPSDRSKAGRSLVDPGGYWEYSVVDRDGDERIVAWHTAALKDDDGRRTGTLCSGADVTEERRLAEEKESAVSASQAKSQFLANMSHEIRTPLNGVLGMIELLTKTGLDERQLRLAETAGLSARNLMSILNDILDFSKIEAGKLALEWVDFDLRQVVEEVCTLFSESAHQKEIELLHVVPPELPTRLIGDPTRLRQILANLLGNAIKFTAEGTVIVAVEALDASDDWLHLRCEVRDSGVGLGCEAVERIFDSFSQADESTTRKFGGTGLGLAISKQLVDLLGGEIGVDSEPGAGSTFWFTVRLARQAEENAPRLERFGPPAPRVLVVEDNVAHVEHLEDTLFSWGIDATTVNDGAAALLELLAAKRDDRPYDALLVDDYMKYMDGLELSAAVEAQPGLSALPVVLMTMTAIPSERRMERAGVTAYVVKPVGHLDLYNAMARALGGVEVPRALRVSDGALPQPLAPFHALVAEDNLVNQEVIQGMVEVLGGQVTLVENGRRALEAFADGAYDVVLMDCQMPVLDGYDASRGIRVHEASNPGAGRVPIIALTAHALGDDREKCLAAGMDGYLAKPAVLRDLARVLGEHLPEKAAAGPRLARPAAAPPAADLDRDALEKIRTLGGGGGSSAFLEKVLNTYLETTPDLIERMREALAGGDADALADAAHTLKSSSASLGAEGLVGLCRRLEKAGREGQLEGAPRLFERLEIEYSQIKAALAEEYLAKSA